MEDLVKCMECKKEFKRISNTHLKFHNLTMAQYKHKYPSSSMECESYCKNMSHAGVNHPLFGIGHTLESRIKMSLGRMGPKNHRYGKKLPEWHKDILRKSRQLVIEKIKGKTFEQIYGKERSEEIKNKIRQNTPKY